MDKELRKQIRGAVARGWCAPVNENKVMDPELAEAIVDQLEKIITEREKEARRKERKLFKAAFMELTDASLVYKKNRQMCMMRIKDFFDAIKSLEDQQDKEKE